MTAKEEAIEEEKWKNRGWGRGKKVKRKEDLSGRTKINGVRDIDLYTHKHHIYTKYTFKFVFVQFRPFKMAWPGKNDEEEE